MVVQLGTVEPAEFVHLKGIMEGTRPLSAGWRRSFTLVSHSSSCEGSRWGQPAGAPAVEAVLQGRSGARSAYLRARREVPGSAGAFLMLRSRVR